MNQRILPVCIFLFLLFSVSGPCLFAQDEEVPGIGQPAGEVFDAELRIGLSSGLTKNFHNGDAYRLIDDPSCPVFNDFDPLWGVSAGLTGTYKFSRYTGVTAHLLYSTHPGRGRSELPNAQVLLPSQDPNEASIIVEQTVRAQTDIAYNLYQLGVMGTMDVVSTQYVRAGIAVGGSVAYVDEARHTIEQQLVEPENARFINPESYPEREKGRVLVFADDEPIPDASSFRASLRAGTYVDFRLFNFLHITPGVYFDYGLTSVVEDSDWTLNVLMYQMDLTVEL